MKGHALNLCSGSFARVQLGDAILNGEDMPVALCSECQKYLFLRLSTSVLGRLAFRAHSWRDDVGIVPRHNGRAA